MFGNNFYYDTIPLEYDFRWFPAPQPSFLKIDRLSPKSSPHWLQVGANPFSESDVTQMNMVKNHIFPEGPRGPDNFFLYYQTLIPTAKETRSRLVSPSSRSIHLLFDLGTNLGDISLCCEGVQPGTHSKIRSKNHSRRSDIASMLLKTVLSVP